MAAYGDPYMDIFRPNNYPDPRNAAPQGVSGQGVYPYTPPAPQQSVQGVSAPSAGLIKVNGIDGAYQYSATLPPNTQSCAFDGSDMLLYMIETYQAGQPKVMAFTLTPYEKPEEAPATEYVTKAEFEEQINSILQAMNKPKTTTAKKAVTENA